MLRLWGLIQKIALGVPRMYWLWFYVVVNIMATAIMADSRELLGDTAGNSVFSLQSLWLASGLVILSYLVLLGPVFTFFSRLKVKKFSFGRSEAAVDDRVGLVLLILSVGYLIFSLKTGANVAGNEFVATGSPLRFVWVLFPVDALFFIYYGYGRESRFFYPNLIVWLVSNFLRGWVGMLLFIAFFEWCRGYRRKTITALKAVLSAAALLVIFPVLTALKFFLRSSARFEMNMAALTEVAASASPQGGFLDAIWGGITSVVGRLQVVSDLVEVIRIKDLLQSQFRDGRILPFWLEGTPGDYYYKFIGDKPDSITLLFPKVHGYMGVGELEATNVNIGFFGWYFIAPSCFFVYVLFVLLLCGTSFYLVKKNGLHESSKDMLWLMWLMFLLPPWFAVFITHIQALAVFLVMRVVLSHSRWDKLFSRPSFTKHRILGFY